ncbi:hypothetical protein ACFV3R_21650 [Streptomyces sp. NPDC059740]|uniref:SCO2195 family GlnR-regulated protein n=1 Tax=Streptomyces sp. NPDC059740 TaxID=3346926 RepID=UPI003653AC4F
MPAAPVRSSAASLPSVAHALRAVEAVLTRRGHRTARRNAWNAVLEDRRRAVGRREASVVLEAVATGSRSDP